MDGRSESRRCRPPIGPGAKAAFLAGLRAGLSREDAAAGAGFSLTGFYGARRRDPQFAADWSEALATSAADERRARAYADRGDRAARGELRIVSANRRIYQRRVRRNVRFDAAAQALFLAHFASNCDLRAAAAAAGVAESTVTLHLRNDSAFAEAFDLALREGYFLLEAEAVRQRLEAQDRLRAAAENASLPAPRLAAEEAEEFERVMKLLARWDRRGAPPGFRRVSHGRQKPMDFDEAMDRLEKRLTHLGVKMPDREGEGAA